MIRNHQIDRFAMMRAAATSMASALLLAIIGSPPAVYYVGFLFVVMAFVFIVGAVIRIPWLSHQLDSFSAGLPSAFLIISLVSIVHNWARIAQNMALLVSGGVLPNWLVLSYFYTPLPWILLFALFFLILVIRDTRSQAQAQGRQRQVIRIVGAIALFCGILYTSIPYVNLSIESVAEFAILAVIIGLGLLLAIWRRGRGPEDSRRSD
jgi:hypothetical protein